VSEVDVNRRVLHSFEDVNLACCLSSDSEGRVLVADCRRDRILLLSSELQLQRVLVDNSCPRRLKRPIRFCYNELRSQLCVLHGSGYQHGKLWAHNLSVFNLR